MLKPTLIILCTAISLVRLEAAVVMDNFNDNTINSSLWNVLIPDVATYVSTPSAAVTETGGRMQLTGRGYLNTATAYKPSVANAVTITGTWTFGSDTDFMQILTRSNGTPNGAYSETQQGIEFQFYGDSRGQISIVGRTGSVSGVTALVLPGGQVSVGESYNFTIFDDGFNVSFEIVEVGNPTNFGRVSGTSTYNNATNLITFHNRENITASSLRTSYLDDVTIVPEPSRALLIGVAFMGLSLRRRRSASLERP